MLIIFTVDCDDDCEIIFEAKYETKALAHDDNVATRLKERARERDSEKKKIVKNAYFGLNFSVLRIYAMA